MGNKKHILLMAGSPRKKLSNSTSLGLYLLDRLREKGCETSTVFITKALKKKSRIKEMLELADKADVLVFTNPLYVDCLPAPVIRAIELIAEHRTKQKSRKKQRLAAILNCGFPESVHNEIACAIYRQFAAETGYDWSGCLQLGGGEIINKQPLAEAGRMLNNARKALDLTAIALSEDKMVPDEASELMAKQVIPTWLYHIIGNHGFKRIAKKNGVADKLRDKPYKEPTTRRQQPPHE